MSPRPPRAATRRALIAVALLASSALALAGCVGGARDPGYAPSGSAGAPPAATTTAPAAAPRDAIVFPGDVSGAPSGP